MITQFSFECRCMASLYLRILKERIGTIRTNNVRKISIDLYHKDTKASQEIYTTVDKICHIEIPYPLEEYFLSNHQDKKKHLLNMRDLGMKKWAGTMSWDWAPFEKTYHSIKEELGYKNQYYYGKRCKSKDGQVFAQIYIDHDIDQVKIYVEFQNSKKICLERRLITSELPDEFIFIPLLNKLEWEDDHVILSALDRSQQWKVTFGKHKNKTFLQ